MKRERFGTLADGRDVEAITLNGSSGVAARIIAYGATLQSVLAPDASGVVTEITLSYPDLESYVSKPQYLGSTIGRVANRIAHARFTLDGKAYALAPVDGAHTLHGGRQGFDKVLWDVVDTSGQSVTLRYVSPDGEEGFPGTLTAYATYSMNDRNELSIEYRATTDRATVVNMTNHALWNLAGEGWMKSVMDHWLMIAADRLTPVDATLIPTGEVQDVAGTPFDFRIAKPIAQHFDHNWVVSDQPSEQPRLIARVEDRASGRVLEMLSDQPGVQFYSGAHLSRPATGFALEAQKFPNAVNQPSFGSLRLAPGEEYRNRIVYRVSRLIPR